MTVDKLIRAMGPTQYSGCFPCCRVEDPYKTLIHSLAKIDQSSPLNPNLTSTDQERLTEVLCGRANTAKLSDEQKVSILFEVVKRNAKYKQHRIIQSNKPTTLADFYTNTEINQHLGVGSKLILNKWVEYRNEGESRCISFQPPFSPSYLGNPSAPYEPATKTNLSDVRSFLDGQTKQSNHEARQLAIQNAIHHNELEQISLAAKQSKLASSNLAKQAQIVQKNSERERNLLEDIAGGG